MQSIKDSYMKRPPNILFLFSDQHRGDWMPYESEEKRRQGVPDLDLHMPNIKQMMDNGTTFSFAYTPAAICAPARACLASGKRYRNCRVYTNDVNYDHFLPSFYGKLSDSGYLVTGVGKFDLNKADLEWDGKSFELLSELGFADSVLDSEGKMDVVWAALKGNPGPYGRMLRDHNYLDLYVKDMSERGVSADACPIPDELYADNWVTDRGCRLLRSIPLDTPWFMQVNFSGPHDPWDITSSMKKKMIGREFPEAADCVFPEENKSVRSNYASMIENIDRNIGLLIEELRKREDCGSTVIVYASDHGEMMGDHGFYGKAKPFQGAVHIPLVIDSSSIGGKKGVRYPYPVELQDLANTFLDFAGIPYDDGPESISLKPITEGGNIKVREYAISELINPNKNGLYTTYGTISDGKYKLIIRGNQEFSLFDLSIDPFELNDISLEKRNKVDELWKAFLARGSSANPAEDKYAASFNLMQKGENHESNNGNV